jgi:hypothetical protein
MFWNVRYILNPTTFMEHVLKPNKCFGTLQIVCRSLNYLEPHKCFEVLQMFWNFKNALERKNNI